MVEELDPFLEEQIKAMGVTVHFGKNVLPLCGEFSQRLVREKISGSLLPMKEPVAGLLMRPPTFCPGCSHRGLYTVLAKLKLHVSGDIGCYTLGALPPFSAMHTCICMGASISAAHGMAKGLALQGGIQQKPVAVIGDSTFLHSGITGLINMVYNGGDAIVDHHEQRHHGHDRRPGARGHRPVRPGRRSAPARYPEALPGHRREAGARDRCLQYQGPGKDHEGRAGRARARGPHLEPALRAALPRLEKGLCRGAGRPAKGAKLCLKAGCIALSFTPEGKTGFVTIDPLLCNGCGVCAQLCTTGSMKN